MPRTVVGLVAGAALGLAGAVMQGLTRNPIADPGLLGVNAGASFAVVAAIIGARRSAIRCRLRVVRLRSARPGRRRAVYGIGAARPGRRDPGPLVLVGAALTAVATSLITLVLLTDVRDARPYRFWSVGSLVGPALAAVRVACAIPAGAASRWHGGRAAARRARARRRRRPRPRPEPRSAAGSPRSPRSCCCAARHRAGRADRLRRAGGAARRAPVHRPRLPLGAAPARRCSGRCCCSSPTSSGGWSCRPASWRPVSWSPLVGAPVMIALVRRTPLGRAVSRRHACGTVPRRSAVRARGGRADAVAGPRRAPDAVPSSWPLAGRAGAGRRSACSVGDLTLPCATWSPTLLGRGPDSRRSSSRAAAAPAGARPAGRRGLRGRRRRCSRPCCATRWPARTSSASPGAPASGRSFACWCSASAARRCRLGAPWPARSSSRPPSTLLAWRGGVTGLPVRAHRRRGGVHRQRGARLPDHPRRRARGAGGAGLDGRRPRQRAPGRRSPWSRSRSRCCCRWPRRALAPGCGRCSSATTAPPASASAGPDPARRCSPSAVGARRRRRPPSSGPIAFVAFVAAPIARRMLGTGGLALVAARPRRRSCVVVGGRPRRPAPAARRRAGAGRHRHRRGRRALPAVAAGHGQSRRTAAHDRARRATHRASELPPRASPSATTAGESSHGLDLAVPPGEVTVIVGANAQRQVDAAARAGPAAAPGRRAR